MCRGGKALRLTVDHKANDPDEVWPQSVIQLFFVDVNFRFKEFGMQEGLLWWIESTVTFPFKRFWIILNLGCLRHFGSYTVTWRSIDERVCHRWLEMSLSPACSHHLCLLLRRTIHCFFSINFWRFTSHHRMRWGMRIKIVFSLEFNLRPFRFGMSWMTRLPAILLSMSLF